MKSRYLFLSCILDIFCSIWFSLDLMNKSLISMWISPKMCSNIWFFNLHYHTYRLSPWIKLQFFIDYSVCFAQPLRNKSNNFKLHSIILLSSSPDTIFHITSSDKSGVILIHNCNLSAKRRHIYIYFFIDILPISMQNFKSPFHGKCFAFKRVVPNLWYKTDS